MTPTLGALAKQLMVILQRFETGPTSSHIEGFSTVKLPVAATTREMTLIFKMIDADNFPQL